MKLTELTVSRQALGLGCSASTICIKTPITPISIEAKIIKYREQMLLKSKLSTA